MENMGKNIQKQMDNLDWKKRYSKLIGDSTNDEEVKKFLKDHSEEIDPKNIERSAARIYEFVQEKKKISEGKVSFAKGYVPALTVNNRMIDVVYIPDENTRKKYKENKFKKDFELIDLPADIRNARLDDYPNRNTGERMAAITAANKFLINYVKNKDFVPGLYLAGDFGVRKTYLLGAIANELVELGFEVSLVHFPTFAVKIKSAISDNTVMDKMNELKSVSVLMIDDIGADALSSWVRDEVLSVILQYRMQENLPTFFSSNFKMKDLKNHLALTRNADEPIKAERIMQRIMYLSREIIIGGENQRLKNQINY